MNKNILIVKDKILDIKEMINKALLNEDIIFENYDKIKGLLNEIQKIEYETNDMTEINFEEANNKLIQNCIYNNKYIDAIDNMLDNVINYLYDCIELDKCIRDEYIDCFRVIKMNFSIYKITHKGELHDQLTKMLNDLNNL